MIIYPCIEIFWLKKIHNVLISKVFISPSIWAISFVLLLHGYDQFFIVCPVMFKVIQLSFPSGFIILIYWCTHSFMPLQIHLEGLPYSKNSTENLGNRDYCVGPAMP